MQRGGKRVGAGRKRLPPEQRTVSKEITFRPDLLNRVEVWAKENGCNLSQAVNSLVTKALEEQQPNQIDDWVSDEELTALVAKALEEEEPT